jgi:hypothetical protein
MKEQKEKFIGTQQCLSRFKEQGKKDEQGICGLGYETQTMT